MLTQALRLLLKVRLVHLLTPKQLSRVTRPSSLTRAHLLNSAHSHAHLLIQVCKHVAGRRWRGLLVTS